MIYTNNTATFVGHTPRAWCTPKEHQFITTMGKEVMGKEAHFDILSAPVLGHSYFSKIVQSKALQESP